MNSILADRCQAYLKAIAAPAPAKRVGSRRAVAISRETGAGAVTIGQLLMERLESKQDSATHLPWAVFDWNLVQRVLKDHKLPESLERYMPEDAAHRIENHLEDLAGLHPSAWTLVQHTKHTIMRLAMTGHAILVGRGSHLITAGMTNVFRVRLVAPLADRVRHVENYYHLSHEEAGAFVLKEDRAKSRYLQRNFKAEPQNALQYHITINTGAVSFPEAARLIADGVLNFGVDQVD